LQHKIFRPGRAPVRRRRRIGADADFAKAMARAEFGRFYVDQRQLDEVSRSLGQAEARRRPKPDRENEAAPPPCPNPKAAGTKPQLWHRPSVRERRTELADAMARLTAGARLRKETGQKE
jgi:hypothetical protein